eukprot:GHVP01047461.1.p1 GENE.GHVP01047461.1~~GHVP01047461.1.p1  ORF type:complete len:264 (+),score=41.72 GHVP01047461.1:48-839(+)
MACGKPKNLKSSLFKCTFGFTAPMESRISTQELNSLHDKGLFHYCPKKTLIIVDWDDTIMPTTFLRNCGLVPVRSSDPIRIFEVRAAMAELESEVIQTMEYLHDLGQTVIVTNASSDWVKRSSENYMPNLNQILQKTPCISAQEAHSQDVFDPAEWKVLGFKDLVASHFKHEGSGSCSCKRETKNIMQIGDALSDRRALMILADQEKAPHFKSCMLVKSPSIDDMVNQHKELKKNLFRLLHNPSRIIDVKFSQTFSSELKISE